MENPSLSQIYIAENAQEMDTDIQRKHIELFVNDYSVDIGTEGESAVNTLYNKVLEINPEICKRNNLFIL